MRPLKSQFHDNALTTLETVLKQTKEARVFRRAQAVRAVVAGQYITTVSATFHFTNSALRKWVQRFATQGAPGLQDRPRSGRPRTVTCELEQHLNRLVDQDPLTWRDPLAVELSRTRYGASPTHRGPPRPREHPSSVKKTRPANCAKV